jgi:hypothetical protein
MLKQMKAWFFEHSLSQNPLTRILNRQLLLYFHLLKIPSLFENRDPLVENPSFMSKDLKLSQQSFPHLHLI